MTTVPFMIAFLAICLILMKNAEHVVMFPKGTYRSLVLFSLLFIAYKTVDKHVSHIYARPMFITGSN